MPAVSRAHRAEGQPPSRYDSPDQPLPTLSIALRQIDASAFSIRDCVAQRRALARPSSPLVNRSRAHFPLPPSVPSLSVAIARLVPSSFSTSEPRAVLALASVGRASAALPCATRAARTPRIVVLLNDSVSFSSSRRRLSSRSCDAQVARAARRSFARSLVLRVRYVKHALPSTGRFPSLIRSLSTISLGRRFFFLLH